ncbi:hypothetical protein GU927_010775 [Rhodobacteraceae bacterium HSP-20]|uniref:CsbD family protein n=1 Tax=Paragemmobacter amnigenus TaxID=2852097 RepID=A0ABS6J3I6_9RHOB|nr:hypothetical protein [Rhodobacter amnigenus]MBU9698329.1 hypothetical protein [Rhodobacter amnigenus]MBV4389556.1 hypothetical protein [Rhodobacter amnigenus]
MDWGRLIQGIGGRLLRQLLGTAMREGINRMAGSPKAKGKMTPEERARHAGSAQTQKRLRDAVKLGRRFWR